MSVVLLVDAEGVVFDLIASNRGHPAMADSSTYWATFAELELVTTSPMV